MAIAGAVVEVRQPEGAYAGEPITVVAVIRNTGDVATSFNMALNWVEAGEWRIVWAQSMTMGPNAQWSHVFSTVMPSASTDYYVRILAVNPDTNAWEQVAWEGPWRVVLRVPGTYSAIVDVEFPARIPAGEQATVVAVIRNTGRLASWLNAWFHLKVGETITGEVPDAVWLEPDESHTFRYDFTMPPQSCQFTVRTLYINPATNDWELGDQTPWTTLVLDVDEYKAVSKPEWLHGLLTTGWINIKRGEWWDNPFFPIPPWTFEVGNTIEGAVDWVIDGLNWLIGKAKGVAVQVVDAWNTAWSALTKIDDWISDFGRRFFNQVEGWWAATYENVKGFVNAVVDNLRVRVDDAFSRISGLDVRITELVTDYDSFKRDFMEEVKRADPFATIIYVVSIITAEGIELLQDLPNFLVNPAAWIFDRIDDWLNEEV